MMIYGTQNIIFKFLNELINKLIYAAVINIPADQPTIQEGINVAVEGDTVLVAPGTYYENIIWPPVNGIKLTGSGEEDCIIDGNQQGNVISFDDINGIVDSTTIISGFTITNGEASCGGGIITYYASPSLKNLIITLNSAGSQGGGLFCFNYSHLIIKNVMITNNYAASEGGGINCDFSSCLTIESCIISSNNAAAGGGICIEGGSSLTIAHTLFNENSAEYGGAIWSGEKGGFDMDNCSLVNNHAEIEAGAVSTYFYNPVLVNCIVCNNTPTHFDCEPYITYSNISGGWAGTGNISTDPLFLDPENGDYHLTENSPCIDAGDPDSPFDPDGTIADMGAFYFNQNIGIEENYELEITNYELGIFPNPFQSSTTIQFPTENIEKNTEIEIYNIKGQKIKTLECINHVDAKATQSLYSIIWNGTDDSNKLVSSGIYFINLQTGNKNLIKKAVLMR